jgi:hypothetical protein
LERLLPSTDPLVQIGRLCSEKLSMLIVLMYSNQRVGVIPKWFIATELVENATPVREYGNRGTNARRNCVSTLNDNLEMLSKVYRDMKASCI